MVAGLQGGHTLKENTPSVSKQPKWILQTQAIEQYIRESKNVIISITEKADFILKEPSETMEETEESSPDNAVRQRSIYDAPLSFALNAIRIEIEDLFNRLSELRDLIDI